MIGTPHIDHLQLVCVRLSEGGAGRYRLMTDLQNQSQRRMRSANKQAKEFHFAFTSMGNCPKPDQHAQRCTIESARLLEGDDHAY